MATGTFTGMHRALDRRPSRRQAEQTLRAARLRAPATVANVTRNARAERDRHARWAPARDALWRLLDPLLAPESRVAVVGAGNGDDLPLARLAERSGELALIDLDVRAARMAWRREPRALRHRLVVIEHDITLGVADAVAASAAAGDVPQVPAVSEAPLPGAPYDLVIGDLFYSQLLYPALVDLDGPERRRCAVLGRYAPILTRAVVARLHVSAPCGRVLHLHDSLGWWPGHEQPVPLPAVLAAARADVRAALRLVARGRGPRESDLRPALDHFGLPVEATALWNWPFTVDAEYLVCATPALGTESALAAAR